MNNFEKQLMQAPSIRTPWCVFCGKKATNYHHVVFRSQGGEKGPVLSVCGLGNASGCHGKLHSRKLHVRYTDRWEYLETEEPTKYQTALGMEGWKPLC